METAAPVAVLQAAINRVVEEAKLAASQKVAGPAPFIAAARFSGRRRGYYFGTGAQGVGYYLDAAQPGAANGFDDASSPAEADSVVAAPQPAPVDPEALLREAEEAAHIEEIQELDARSLKRLLLAFERKTKENLELRMKHPDAPERFMDSEVELAGAVRSISQVAGSPELYPVLVEGTAVATLLNLLTHDNSDIAADVIELFQELTDADAVEDSEEEARMLVDAMLESAGAELLVQRLTQLDESVPEEDKAVMNALSIIENMVELRSEVATTIVSQTKLLPWLLRRVRVREMDSNKQAASEVLAILMQGNEQNQKRLGAANGIEGMLTCIAYYKSRDPQNIEEEEFLENCYNVLCSSLMLPENKAAFMKAEGVELMVLILQQRRLARFGAIKTLDFATTRWPPACERFVDSLGLKHLFALFMGKARVRGPKGEGGDVAREVEERLVSIIANLFQGLGKGSRRDRLAAKFVEAECEKCDRLAEVYFRYVSKVEAEEARLAADPEADLMDEEEVLLARMDAGLYTLQQLGIIVGNLWAVGDVGLRKRIVMLLHQKGHALANIKGYLLECYATLGTEGGAEERQRQQRRLGKVLLALGATPEELEAAKGEESQNQQQGPALPQPAADTEAAPPPPPEMDMDVEMEADEPGPAPVSAAAASKAAYGNGVATAPDDAEPTLSKAEVAAIHHRIKQRKELKERERAGAASGEPGSSGRAALAVEPEAPPTRAGDHAERGHTDRGARDKDRESRNSSKRSSKHRERDAEEADRNRGERHRSSHQRSRRSRDDSEREATRISKKRDRRDIDSGAEADDRRTSHSGRSAGRDKHGRSGRSPS